MHPDPLGTVVLVAAPAGGVVVAVVLAAAVAHAGWNLMAKAMDDQVVAFWLINLAAAVCGVVLLVVSGLPARAAWPYLAVSVALHLGYNTTLLNSYRFGDLGQVYPLSRGIAPLGVTAFAAVFAGEELSGAQLLGLAVIAGGVGSIVWLGGAGAAGRDRRAVVLVVSALRETSVVVAALVGTLVLHEGSGHRRLLAAAVVCAGVAVLVVS